MRLRFIELFEDDDLNKDTLLKILYRYNGMSLYVSKKDAKTHFLRSIWKKRKELGDPKSTIVKIFANYGVSRVMAYKYIRDFENEQSTTFDKEGIP